MASFPPSWKSFGEGTGGPLSGQAVSRLHSRPFASIRGQRASHFSRFLIENAGLLLAALWVDAARLPNSIKPLDWLLPLVLLGAKLPGRQGRDGG